MNGNEWLNTAMKDEKVLREIPLELTATMPVPSQEGSRTLVCLHYFAKPAGAGIRYQHPRLLTVWNDRGNMLEKRELEDTQFRTEEAGPFLNTGKEERAYLEDVLTAWLDHQETEYPMIREAWLRTLPVPVAEYVNQQGIL